MRSLYRVRFLSIVAAGLSTLGFLQAQPPQILNHQGRLSVNGYHFDGVGQFKFALVDGGTDGSITASAAATVAGGFLVTIDVLDGGAGYTEPPAITIDDATGTGATATAQIEGGRVTAITVVNPGSGYSVAVTVTIAAPPPDIAYVSYWSHDESSIDGGEPGTAIDLAVTRGLYAVPLGDGSLPNMTAPITPAALANPDVRLRVWFDDGAHGFRQLVPDQRVTSVGYALMAANVHGLQEALDEKSDAAHTHSAAAITSGVLDAARIPDLDAAKITAGTLADARIPDLNAARITAGTFDAARIPDLPADRIASGVLDAARIPNLDAAQITSGTLNEARIPNAFWRLDGNPDTTPDTHFLGTTDDQALELRANNQRALRIEPDAESPRIVAGHASNVVSGVGATVSGGGSADFPNRATNNYATVGGGTRNTAGAGYATVGGGEQNTASAGRATVGGGWGNTASAGLATVGGGRNNTASGWDATVGGGSDNTASGTSATVGGGWDNTVSGDYGTIPGGRMNIATNYAFAAGRRARANHQGSFVWADSTNAVFASSTNDQFAVRAGGGIRIAAPFLGTTDNQALELRANNLRALRIEPDAESPRIVAGHASNVVSGAGATVSGGGSADFPNRSTNNYATVGGGSRNTASAEHATVGGGYDNTASFLYATVGGGYGNIASFWYATVGGGLINTASGRRSTIGGGWSNRATAESATVGGGVDNWVTAESATVGGGCVNRANGSLSTVAGGGYNRASGDYATIPGGEFNIATNYAFAAGRRAKANHQGAFVWGDSTFADVASTANNQVTFRSAGGFRIFSNSGLTLGAELAPGATSWTALSDREAKQNFNPIDAEAILDALADMSVTTWNYKADPDQRRYIGPVAQDFHAAFGLGSDTRIATLDADGVLFAAVQGLHARNAALQAEVARAHAENERLASELEAIKKHLGL